MGDANDYSMNIFLSSSINTYLFYALLFSNYKTMYQQSIIPSVEWSISHY